MTAQPVQTVLGPVNASDLGPTLMHEHVFIDVMREYRGEGLLRDQSLAAREVADFVAHGGRTLVDCTSVGIGRDPEALRDIALATGAHIVMGAGFYRDPYLDRRWFDARDASEVAEVIVSDLVSGVGASGIRAGIIGEIGCDASLSSVEERSFRAAARAHRQVGTTISTHAARWPVGLRQLAVLESEGVDPARVIIGHADTVPDAGYRLELARAGAWVQLDTIRGETDYDTQLRLSYLIELLDAGFGRQVLLSHDVCLSSHLRARGGPGYTYILSEFAGLMRARGIDDETATMLMVENPRRALTGQP